MYRQRSIFLDRENYLFDYEKVLENINMLITWARHSEVPIIFIQYTDSTKDDDFAFSKPGWDL